MALYLAFDVGGTKTACLLADEGRILARAEAGSIKTLRISHSEARANLEAALLQLLTTSGADLRQVRRTCVGTSGASAPSVRTWMRQAFAETVGSELVLLGDEVIALDAAFPGRRGILVIAGTGSNIVGRAASGQMAHSGGWGPMLADEGSGHWIGHQAIRACFRAIDGAPASSADYVEPSNDRDGSAQAFFAERNLEDLPPLLRRFLTFLNLPDLDSMIGVANALEFRFARLVPVVVEAARAGDPLARETLLRAGQALAVLVSQAIEKVTGLEAGMSSRFLTPEVAYLGGVLTNIVEVREAMRTSLLDRYANFVLHPEPVNALAGALWHARGCP